MANDSFKNSPAAAARPGEKPPAGNPVAVARNAGHSGAAAVVSPVHAVASVQPAPVAAPPAKPPEAFGGHRGGGKKRADGLVAGSPEAKQVDLQKDAARKRAARALQKPAALPPVIPSVAAPPQGAVAAPVAGGATVPGVAAGAVAAAAVAPAPLFVAWSEKILARPIKLLMRIVDRVRCSSLMKRIRKLKLRPEQEKEIEADIKFKQEAVDDFNAALANCVTIELNKRRVSGAENSHWLDVLMTGGELVATHLTVVDKIEAMILENETRKKQEQK